MLPSLEFITLLLVLTTRCSQESPEASQGIAAAWIPLSLLQSASLDALKWAKDYSSLHSSLGLHLTSYDHEWGSVTPRSPDTQIPTYFRHSGAEGVRIGEGNSNLDLSGRAHGVLYSQCVFRPLLEFLMALFPCYLQSLFSLLSPILLSTPSLLSQILFYKPYKHTYTH